MVGPRRRKGIGRRLAGRLLDLVNETGIDTVRLSVASANPDAHAFWTSMGWADLEEVLEKEVEKPASDGG